MDVSYIGYSGKKIIYTSKNQLIANQFNIQLHYHHIKHIIVDQNGIIITASHHLDPLKIVSVQGQTNPQIINQFNYHNQPITALYWKNSLAITADMAGHVCLWDVNKCQIIHTRQIHYQPVQFIHTYCDYRSNNTFYTLSSQQKRIVFSDLRTNKPIKILSNLHSKKVKGVIQTQSGKVIIAYQDIIDVVDIYRGYDIVGNFSPLVIQKKTQKQWTTKSLKPRKISQVKLMGKHLIAGCDNGCIEVYDTDSLECLYGFGIVQFGGVQELECSNTNKLIAALDAKGDVYLAKFSKQSHTKPF